MNGCVGYCNIDDRSNNSGKKHINKKVIVRS